MSFDESNSALPTTRVVRRKLLLAVVAQWFSNAPARGSSLDSFADLFWECEQSTIERGKGARASVLDEDRTNSV